MADDPIIITIADAIDPAIATGLTSIAENALAADEALTSLTATTTQSTISAKDFAAMLQAAGGDLAKVSLETTTATESMRGYTAAQIELFQVQQDGLNFQNALNESFGITTAAGESAAKSARDSAAAFKELLAAADATSISMRNAAVNYQQVIDATVGVGASAGVTAADVAAMGVALDELRAQFSPLFAAEQKHTEALAAMNEAFALGAINIYELTAAIEAEGLAYDATVTKINGATAALEEGTVAAKEGTAAFGGLAKVLVGFFALTEVVSAADSYVRLSNALHLAGLQGQAFDDTFNQLIAVAEKNGVAADALASVYQKLTLAQQTVGLSNSQLLQVTTAVAESFRLQGASAQTTYNAMRDLGEIADLTTVKWVNFYRLQQQAFPLIRAAAAGAGVSIAQFDDMVHKGDLTTKAFFEDIIKGQASMDKLAASTNLTISGALSDFNTALVGIIHSADEGTGILGLLAKGIQFLAENLQTAASVLIVFGIAWAAVKFAELVVGFTELVQGVILFTLAMVPAVVEVIAFAAPMLIVLGIVVGLTAAILALTGQTDNFVKMLGSVVNAAVTGLGLDHIGDAMKALAGNTGNAIAQGAQFAAGQYVQEAAGKANSAAVDKTTASMAGLTTAAGTAAGGLGQATGSMGTLGVASTSTGAKIMTISQNMMDAYTSANSLSNSTVDLNDNLATTITRADGTTASLTTFTDAQYAAADAMNASSAAAQTLADRLATLQSRQAANPSLFNDPDNNNGDFPDISGNFSGEGSDGNSHATGTSFMVGGKQGTDKNLVRFWASADERVDVLTPQQQRGQAKLMQGSGTVNNVNVTIVANDPGQFRNSKAQIGRQLSSMIASAG